jgi:hypothetical protein
MNFNERMTGRDDRTAVAQYVATITAELSVIARSQGLDTLGYLLEMVRLEAENASRNVTGRS